MELLCFVNVKNAGGAFLVVMNPCMSMCSHVPLCQTALERFFDALYQALLRHVDFTTAKAVLLASPAYVREDFRTFLMEQAVRKRDVVRGAKHAACLSVFVCVCLCVSRAVVLLLGRADIP